jgi:hypothetical protein
MAAEQYIILLHNNEWKISFNDKLYGPYASQQDAIEAAIDAAYAMGEIGIDAQVLVQDTDQNAHCLLYYRLSQKEGAMTLKPKKKPAKKLTKKATKKSNDTLNIKGGKPSANRSASLTSSET